MFGLNSSSILKNKKAFIVLGAILLAVPLLFLTFQDGKKKTVKTLPSISVTPRPPIKELNGKTKVILDAVGETGREGWVIIQASEGKTWLNINIDADEVPEDDHDFPATLRSGSCHKLGDVIYRLTAAENGGSETTLGMSLEQFRASLPLSLVVEQSPTDHNVVACGDITGVYY